ncbi:MAG: hypothetical protein WCG34_07505 [Leptolinea sp.]
MLKEVLLGAPAILNEDKSHQFFSAPKDIQKHVDFCNEPYDQIH